MDLGYEAAANHWWTCGGKWEASADTASEQPENTISFKQALQVELERGCMYWLFWVPKKTKKQIG